MAEKSSENRKASTKPQRQKDKTYSKTQSATKKKRKRIYRRTYRGGKADSRCVENQKKERMQHRDIVLKQVREYFIQEKARDAIQKV